jgi:Ca2+-binding RTX toxin-like protein
MAIVLGTNSSETIEPYNAEGTDFIYGYDGNDHIFGFGGNDIIHGGSGADNIYGGNGSDTSSYSDSTAGVVVNLATHQGHGGYAEGDYLSSIENLTGSSYKDLLIGDDGNNELRGLGGNDTLKGGGGADQINGLGGEDTFVFHAGEANGDILFDFQGNGQGSGDVIYFVGYGTAAEGATFHQLDATHWEVSSADGTIHDIITLAGAPTVDASDFSFY